MATTIKIATQLGADIRTRSFFRNDIENILHALPDNCYVLDFQNVIFISRSVADEICNILEDHANISVNNMSGDVRKMYDVVVNGRNNPREYPASNIKVFHLKTMKELSEFFATF